MARIGHLGDGDLDGITVHCRALQHGQVTPQWRRSIGLRKNSQLTAVVVCNRCRTNAKAAVIGLQSPRKGLRRREALWLHLHTRVIVYRHCCHDATGCRQGEQDACRGLDRLTGRPVQCGNNGLAGDTTVPCAATRNATCAPANRRSVGVRSCVGSC